MKWNTVPKEEAVDRKNGSNRSPYMWKDKGNSFNTYVASTQSKKKCADKVTTRACFKEHRKMLTMICNRYISYN